MSVLRYVLPAVAVAQAALAQECSVTATTTIQNDFPAGCQTFSGSIAIATGTSGTININGVKELDGNLVVSNVSLLTGLSASSLTTIKGDFHLDTVQVLSSLSFPMLTTVNNIIWNALPNLQQLAFTAGVTKASSVDIENTQLNTLDGISLVEVDSFTVANNPYLNKVNLQLGNISQQFTLEANSPQIQASFPNLIWANNMTFRNCGSIDLPELVTVNGSMGFYGNNFQSFAAPNLTTIGTANKGDLSFVSNTQLTNISLPALTTVNGGCQVANNTQLKKIDGFPKLATIGGALDFHGNFTEVDLPSLKDVKGAFNLQSSSDISQTCSNFASLQNSVVKGKYQCAGDQTNPGSENTTPTGAGASPTKKGAAGHLDVSSSAIMGVSGVLAAVFGLL